MYLTGLGEVTRTRNLTRAICENQFHGSFMPYNTVNATWDSLGDCMIMEAPKPVAQPAPPAQISVNVPTNVNTQVSPQVSPNLIQQQQPTNSPVGAATTANPSQSTAGEEIYQRLLDEIEAARRQTNAGAMDTLSAQQTPGPALLAVDRPATVDNSDNGSSVTIAPTNGQTYAKYGLIAALLIGGAILYSNRNKKR